MAEENTTKENTTENTAENTAQTESEQPTHNFGIQRVYLKDMSFESPSAPQIFVQTWQPEVNFDLRTKSSKIEDEVHEVELHIVLTAKVGEETAFLIDITFAGIFSIQGYEDQQLHAILGTACPSILFPYVREAISEMVARGGFPNLYLNPIHFDNLYAQHLKAQQQKAAEQAGSAVEDAKKDA